MNTYNKGINNIWRKNRKIRKLRSLIKIYTNIYAFNFSVKKFIKI